MKKHLFLLAYLSLGALGGYSQSIAINNDGSKPNPNAIVDVKSTTKGVLLPRMTTAERHKIPNTKGLLVYDTDENLYWYNDGASWQSIYTTDLFKKNGAAWSLTGNSHTQDKINFIGTKDDVPLNFRVNNQPAGRIDSAKHNTFFGYQTCSPVTDANSNTAIGAYALHTDSTGAANTAIGCQALLSNSLGGGNTATGFQTLYSLFAGFDNTADGVGVLYSQYVAFNNTGSGAYALAFNTTGSDNTAMGASSMYNSTSGDLNTAIGVQSMYSNITGSNNTAVGTLADMSSGNLNNATAIGNGAIVNASNKVRIGNTAVTVIEGQVPFTTPSDGRFKFNIQENVRGLDFIMKLRPVTYQFDVKKQEGFTRGTIKPGELNNYITSAGNDEATQMIRTGFIAQEVEQAAKKTGYDFDGVKAPRTEREYYSLSYSSFVVPLVKAMQEQQQIISSQNQRISNLEQELAEIKTLLQSKHN